MQETLRAQFQGGMTAEEMGVVRVDLLRNAQNRGKGYSDEQVERILSGINVSTGDEQPGSTDLDFGQILNDAGRDFRGGSFWRREWRGMTGAEGARDALGNSVMGIGDLPFLNQQFEVGGRFNGIATTREQESAISAVREGIAGEQTFNEENYGPQYARQEELRSANDAVAEAVKTGNQDLVAALTMALSRQLGLKGQVVSMRDLENYGDFTTALEAQDRGFARQVERGYDNGMRLGGTAPGLQPIKQDSSMTTLLDGIELFGRAVSNRAEDIDSAMNKAVTAYRKVPSPENFRRAVDEVAVEAERTGVSLAGLADAAVETMNQVGSANDPTYQVAQASLQYAQQRNQQSAGIRGTGATLATGIGIASNMMNADPNSDTGPEMIAEGREQFMTLRAQASDMYKARIAANVQYFTTMRRSTASFNLQQEYAQEDFERSISRTREDYGIQRVRAQANFQRQESRAYEDFGRSMARATEDFGRNTVRAQEDYNLGRLRAQRDFNKQMRRMNEDAAKSMYDPYKRIQVQAVYDMGTLMTNLAEQNRAMQEQAANLERLRAAGVNNNVIDQLGLNRAENAQQLQRLLADIEAGGAGSAQALNNMINARMRAAGTLNMDESNKDIQRSREDFNQQLADQEADLEKSTARQREDFNRQMRLQRQDFNRQMARQREDFARGLAEQASDFERSMDRAADDQERSMQRMEDAFRLSMRHAAEDHARAQMEIVGDYQTLQGAMQETMKGNIEAGTRLMRDTAVTAASEVKKALDGLDPDLRKMFTQDGVIQLIVNKTEATNSKGTRNYTRDQDEREQANNAQSGGSGGHGGPGDSGRWRGMWDMVDRQFPSANLHSAYRPGAITATGNPSYHGKGRAIDITPRMDIFNWIKANFGARTKELIYSPAGNNQVHNGKDHYYSGITRSNHWDHIHWAMQRGGIVNQPTKVLVGEARDNEAIIPLNQGGVAMMAEAMRRYLSPDAITGMATKTARTHVIYQTTNTNIDQRTQVTGAIQVVSQDPDEMARKLAAKARRDNLGQTPTRR